MNSTNYILKILTYLLIFIFLKSCGIYRPTDAKDFPPEPEKRVQKNIQEGRGFKLLGGNKKKGGDFEFASSNEMWRASLDILEFMPLLSADYGGGLIITDWYSDNSDDEIKIKDAADLICKRLNVVPDWKYRNSGNGSAKRRCPDLSKLKNILPEYSPRKFEEIIECMEI